ncbi:putative glycosyl transferase [Chondrocystis sp. NIES-4102]|nr:putative glycosyl transferase [Chondrocystis sp. NIES-4102]
MKYHVPLTKFNDLQKLPKRDLEAQSQQCSRSDLWMIAERLGANIYQPETDTVSLSDKLRGKITGIPHFWSYARRITQDLGSDDCIYCEGEQLGIAVAAVAGQKKHKPKIAVHFHNINRPRGKLSLKLFKAAENIDLFIVHCRAQYEFLQNYLNLPPSKLGYFWYPTDCQFFTPGKASSNKTRPLIVSVGLENRDYRVLAAATENLDVDVKIAGFSQFTSRLPDNFPSKLPANMSNSSYTLPQLLQLYHDADIVVVCIEPSNWSAGATALIEAMACGKPIILTKTEGLKEYITDEGAIMGVKPSDPEALRQAIAHLLANPQQAQTMAEKAYQLALQRHQIEQEVEAIALMLFNL